MVIGRFLLNLEVLNFNIVVYVCDLIYYFIFNLFLYKYNIYFF